MLLFIYHFQIGVGEMEISKLRQWIPPTWCSCDEAVLPNPQCVIYISYFVSCRFWVPIGPPQCIAHNYINVNSQLGLDEWMFLNYYISWKWYSMIWSTMFIGAYNERSKVFYSVLYFYVLNIGCWINTISVI